MQKLGAKKIKLGRKNQRFWAFLAVYLVFWAILGPHKASSACLWINRQCYVIELSDSSEKRQKGLSGRDSMAINQGMLFVFDQSEIHCFWMKDMKFDLDMIWLDSNKRVVKILSNVKADSYPDSFCPNEPAKYVVELNSGVSKILGLNLGQKLHF